MKSLVLFSNDLRLNDNDAINSAVKSGCEVTFLFIYDSKLYVSTHGSANLWWLQKSIKKLKQSFKEKNLILNIVEGDFVNKALEITDKYKFYSVHINENKHPEFIKKEKCLLMG